MAKPRFVEAIELQNASKLKEARLILQDLLNTDPYNPILQFAYGTNCMLENVNGVALNMLRGAMQGVDDGAIQGWQKLGIILNGDAQALKNFVRKQKADIYMSMGCANRNENNIKEARRLFAQARALIPSQDKEYTKWMADLLNNEGSLYLNEGNPAKGIELYSEAIRLNPKHELAHWNLALCQLELFDWSAWDNYDYGDVRRGPLNRNYEVPRWDGSAGNVIVVNGEQGIGDEILFASCIPDARRDCKEVVFDCHKRLKSIFEASFPSMAIHGTRESDWIDWPRDYPLEAKCALGSLPKFYRRSWDAFPGTPYLKAPRPGKYLERLRGLGSRPKIGISWMGGHKRTRIEVRSTGLEAMLPILRHDCDFISLQYTPQAQGEINEVSSRHGVTVHHWEDIVYAEDYGETANLVADLDLVISVCTSLVHLAGAMGKDCWVLTPSRPAWRYGISGNRMPWYKSVELLRMASGSTDWTPVIEEVSKRLGAWLGERMVA